MHRSLNCILGHAHCFVAHILSSEIRNWELCTHFGSNPNIPELQIWASFFINYYWSSANFSVRGELQWRYQNTALVLLKWDGNVHNKIQHNHISYSPLNNWFVDATMSDSHHWNTEWNIPFLVCSPSVYEGTNAADYFCSFVQTPEAQTPSSVRRLKMFNADSFKLFQNKIFLAQANIYLHLFSKCIHKATLKFWQTTPAQRHWLYEQSGILQMSFW